jgi:DNA modification methylase
LGNQAEAEKVFMKAYEKFLDSKRRKHPNTGLSGELVTHPSLFKFQRDIVHWAIRKGRAALFEDCGLGKTRQQLEWAKAVFNATGQPVIVFAPLAVSSQTVREAKIIGVDAYQCASEKEVRHGIAITNYEKLHKFDPTVFSGVVLDESSILKSYDGAFRTALIEAFAKTPYRLACTATPAPNDYMELGNHAEFLGVMSRSEMLSTFFVHDGGQTSKWRLKGHAESEFWRWLCSWAVMIRFPSDLGYNDDGFKLPKLEIINSVVQSLVIPEDTLFAMPASSLQERRAARRGSIDERIHQAATIVNNSAEQWLCWCDLNHESKSLCKAIPDAIEVTGSDSEGKKIDALMGFAEGRYRVLVSKPSICGHGMNFQNCHQQIFVGLNDSYEQYYQGVRRSWRFGQKQPVTVHIITSHLENAVLENIHRKEIDHDAMATAMIEHMKTEMKREIKYDDRHINGSVEAQWSGRKSGQKWDLINGDCVTLCQKLKNDSIHYSIFSPPFSSLYTYSASDLDMGNCRNDTEFHEHFRFLIKELYRVLMPGRLLSFHCMNLPSSKAHNGYIGIRDFRGHLIQDFVEAGFIYHSEVCIWKDPVTAMQRTKALGLLHKQLKKDSCMSRQGIPDYLVTMRKPGENPERVTHANESFPVQLWQQYASPVWMDINPSETLQRDSAREEKDERHIAPLQLQVIRRALELWTNPGDWVLSPFAGIGSEGYEAIKAGRRFIGFELKFSYFHQAVANLKAIEEQSKDLLTDLAKNV